MKKSSSIITKQQLFHIIKEEIRVLTEKRQNILVGGRGDNTDEKDVDQKQLEIGIHVEMEHTNNSKIAKEVAIDHLSEHDDYYTKLIKAGLVDEPEAIELYKKYYVKKKSDKKDAEENGDGEESNEKVEEGSKWARIISPVKVLTDFGDDIIKLINDIKYKYDINGHSVIETLNTLFKNKEEELIH